MRINWNTKGGKNVFGPFELKNQIVIRFGTTGFVSIVNFMTISGSRQVETSDHKVRLEFADNFQKHRGKTVERSGRLTL